MVLACGVPERERVQGQGGGLVYGRVHLNVSQG